MPFIMIIQIYGLFNEDSAGLLIGEFTPIQCKTNFCFDFIFVLEQLLKDGFVIANVYCHAGGTGAAKGLHQRSDPRMAQLY